MTDRQLSVLSIWLTVFSIVLPLWKWLSNKLDLVGEKQMRRDLEKIKELGEERYSEQKTQRMRFYFCLGAYLFCCRYIIPHGDVWFQDALLPAAAATCFLIASGMSQATTVYGVRERVNHHRKRLNLPEDQLIQNNNGSDI